MYVFEYVSTEKTGVVVLFVPVLCECIACVVVLQGLFVFVESHLETA